MIHRIALFLALPLLAWAQTPQECVVELFIGDPEFSTGDGGPALNAKFGSLHSLVAADDGTIYVADAYAYRIRRVDPQGIITTIAGTGTRGTSGDGGPAVQAQLGEPNNLKLAADGSLYFTDSGVVQHRIRRITTDGVIETLYVQREGIFHGIAVAPGGIVYFTETSSTSGDIVRGLYRLESDGSKTAIAGGKPGLGNGTADGVPALDYLFESPVDVLLAANGDLVVTDGDRIMRIAEDGVIRVIAGNGDVPFVDGAPALEADLGFPNSLALDAAGDLLILDGREGLLVVQDGVIHRLYPEALGTVSSSAAGVFFSTSVQVFKLLPDETAQVIAGVDRNDWYDPGRPLDQSFVRHPLKMLTDSQNRLYYFESASNEVWRTTLDGKLEIVAGGGAQPADDGVLAVDAALTTVRDIAIDSQDRINFVVYPSPDRPSMLLRVELDGTLTVVAGVGAYNQSLIYPGLDFFDMRFAVRSPMIALAPDGSLAFYIPGNPTWLVTADGIVTVPLPLTGLPPQFMAYDPEGRLLYDGSVYDDPSSEPFEPFSSNALQTASASNGTYFGRPFGGVPRAMRRTPEGRTTELFAAGAQLQFENGTLTRNAGLKRLTAIATNREGDLFVADAVLDRVFVIRDADTCSMERPYSAGILRGASFLSASDGFVPGEIISVFGDFLGGDTLAYGAPGVSSQGTWQTEVGGLEVFVDDQPAPIIFSRADQAAFVIPNEVSGNTHVRFRRNGLDSPTYRYEVTNAAPGLFTVDASGGGQAAALNEDTSINSPDNPAAPGSVIVLYLTGAGATDPPSVTGSLNDFPLPQLVETVHVSINYEDAVVEFAGPAPGLISGVVQVNARIPANTPSRAVRVTVYIGGVASRTNTSSQRVTISVQ